MLKMVLAYGWASSPERLAIAAVVTLCFAVLARVVRGVDRSGMFAGGAACFLLFAGAGPSAFATLVTLFLLTWISTRFGYRRKQELGVAERGDGRNAWQVLANLAVPAMNATAFGMTGNRMWLVATVATLAEAATDTVASEVGQSYSRTAVMITSWKPVSAGTDGGITVMGTIAGTIAGFLIAGSAALCGLVRPAQLWIPVTAGFAGMLADSLLGASLQRRGWMNNEAVNLAGTIIAAGAAVGTWHLALGS
ncbi:MAG TPA: DUF92 domain-containing protein [Terriglobales bacterium]|jgi:uncharacterized protein (TIGR00297 family)|nr:DUF92 domain-containing protein [Terriglobales bacterium]